MQQFGQLTHVYYVNVEFPHIGNLDSEPTGGCWVEVGLMKCHVAMNKCQQSCSGEQCGAKESTEH